MASFTELIKNSFDEQYFVKCITLTQQETDPWFFDVKCLNNSNNIRFV